ncbi:P1 family peptidase [Demequina capsici]|uniref:P1 family peptidase n=1 Tax=Demequina capsici TaxID=3075620 RepID=A0AA96J854_9MICO|nr:P1 family peptidase [Demequina sp. OYTSA14]WNM25887.1 P1 family peptidase [Demequina sp. OYTSA14]
MNATLTALPGVRVGHATHLDRLTGCTVVLFDSPATVALKAYGGGAGGFNTEGLHAGRTDYRLNGIFVAGGSSTGLMAGASIMEAMRRDGVGFRSGPNGGILNPSITGAAIYDLGMSVAPFEADYGREAYVNASTAPVASGSVGAGTGASVGKFLWLDGGTKVGAMKAGVGSARVDLGGGIIVTAMSVVNAVGNVVLPTGQVLAGNRAELGGFAFYDQVSDIVTRPFTNTTITVVGTNVDLGSKEHYEKLAHLATHGQVRAINPVHTSADGDSLFVFSTATLREPLNPNGQYFKEGPTDIHLQVDLLGHAAARAVQESIYDACRAATTVPFEEAYGGVIPAVDL